MLGTVLCRRCARTSPPSSPPPPVLSPEWALNVALDLLVVALPILLSVTVTQYRVAVYGSLLLLAIALAALSRRGRPRGGAAGATPLRLEFINDYRALLLFLTCVAILAVDFPVFPRIFAKTETFGYSLMDIGVGSFVFSNALVSRKARAAALGRKEGGARGLLPLVKSTAVSVSPMVILGAIRLISTKSTDYQEHVSEYGVHWNFFFTLASVALLVSVLHVPIAWCVPVGLLVAGLYQVALSSYGLEEFVLHGERTDLFSMNKEGICSSLGYFAICSIGTWVGHCLFSLESGGSFWAPAAPRAKGKGRSAAEVEAGRMKSLLFLVVLDVAAWALTYLSATTVSPPSRRMANLTYVLFTLAYNVFLVALLRAIDLYTHGTDSLMLQGLNRNGLLLFLVANLSTGVVNMSMHTIFASDATALLVLSVYVSWLAILAATLQSIGLTFKFW